MVPATRALIGATAAVVTVGLGVLVDATLL